jgi:phage portal protein BeeE
VKLFQALSKRSETFGLDELIEFMQFQGLNYPVQPTQTLGSPVEEIGGDFQGLAQAAYKQNGVVFACMMVRQLLFQEARFKYRRLESGRPGEYFGTTDLVPLEKPTPNSTTGDLLARVIQDVDLAGNWYGLRRNNQIHRLHPEYVWIVLGSKADPDYARTASDTEVIGYAYKPPMGEAEFFLPEEIAHFAPYPDPMANFRGMSWLTPVIREIMGDQAAMTHKLKFFEQGATVNMVVKFEAGLGQKEVEEWIKLMESQIGGAANAYRTLYLGGGADATPVGSNLKDVAFKEVVGAGETRIAAAAGVPPVIVGLSEGLQAATYSNYSQARRRFADGTMRPLWRNIAASLSSIIRVPPRAELWYDDRDIPFLADDQKEAAETQATNAQAIKALTDTGYEPGSVVDAVTAGDLKRLKHSGLMSVQLLPPGTNGKSTEKDGGEGKPPAEENSARAMLERAKDQDPPGEADLRGIIERFEEVEAEVRSLLVEAITGDRGRLLGRALIALNSLRSERVEDAVHLAYEAAYDNAVADIEAQRSSPGAERLAESLQEKLMAAITEAEGRSKEAFSKVDQDNLTELSQDAVTGFVDEADRRWALGAYAANEVHTLGRRATSRGVKAASAGGMVRISSHGTKVPICIPLEGKVFPATSAPEPPFHSGCEHMLEAIG